jgi:hypothetical protein
MAAGGIAVAATLALGVAGASAAPNPGYGTPGYTLVPAQTGPPAVPALLNTGPTMNSPFAQEKDGPQTANVPTLAWVGEDVRLVACDDAIDPNPLGINSIDFQQADWTSGESGDLWTGAQADPPSFDGSAGNNLYVDNTGSAFFFPPDGLNDQRKGCVSADISSLVAGLDEVTLTVTDEGVNGGRGIDPVEGASNNSVTVDPATVYQEQFIVIWMTAVAPTLTEATPTSIELPTTAGSAGTTTPGETSQLTTAGVTALDAFLGDGVTTPVDTFAGLDPWVGAPTSDLRDVNDTPPTNNGLIDVKVTGQFPVEDQAPSTINENYFAGLTGGANGAQVTLPNQWPALANLLATSSTQNTSDNTGGGNLWDIHGSPTNTLAVQGHAGASTGVCAGDGTLFLQTTDVVDDCITKGGGDPYAFSRVFGDVTWPVSRTIGPYDAQDPDTTLLSDGQLTTDDAPMPALPITVSIATNKLVGGTDPNPIGGIGGLYGVSKWQVYSHDFDGSFAGPVALTSTGLANLYNPYYQEYIPSTLRPITESSGVTGVYRGGAPATSGDDFPGFTNGDTDPYTFWKAEDASTGDKTSVENGCLEDDPTIAGSQGTDFSEQNPAQITDGGLNYFGTPDYPTTVTVYTDERGEAYVDYNPGTGFYNTVAADLNGACDLVNLYGDPIGTSTISAKVEYPYETVPYFPPAASDTITKTVDSEWEKTLTVLPKGNLSGNEISVVVAHAQNINGEPFSGELVCVQAPSNESVSFDGISPSTALSVAGSSAGATPVGYSSNYTCGYTGTLGNVAFDVSGSNGQTNVDVQALFVTEHIFRDVNIPVLGQTTPVTSTSPPGVLPADQVVAQTDSSGAAGNAGAPGGSPSAPAASNPGNTTGGAPAVVITQSVAPKAHTASVKFARLVHGKRKSTVSLDIKSSGKTQAITIKVYGKHGKLLRTLHFTVKTNTTVSVGVGSGTIGHVAVSV